MHKLEKYSSYKDSGVEWLGEIPSEWEVKRIKHLFSIGRGRVISQQELDDNGKYPVYSSQTKNNGILGYIKTYDFDCKQITWTTDGANAGTIFLREGKHNCTNVCGTLQPYNKYEQTEFINYTLQISAQFYKRPDTNGAKIMNNEMADIFITYPPLQEQQNIASFLDTKTEQLDIAIKQKEKLIELLKERKQIVINEAVTCGIDKTVTMKDSGVEWIGEIPEHWEVKKLKFIIKDKLKYGANESGIEYNEQLPRYVRITDFSDEGKLSEKNKLSLSWENGKEYLLKDGDILFARSGATVGKTYQFKKSMSNEKFYSFAGYLIKAEADENIILSDFLYLYTNSDLFEKWKSFIFNKATIENIGADKYSELFVTIPSIIEQKEILQSYNKEISKIDNAIDLQQKQIDKLKEYKTSLIDSVVTGKVKVCDE